MIYFFFFFINRTLHIITLLYTLLSRRGAWNALESVIGSITQRDSNTDINPNELETPMSILGLSGQI